MAIRGCGIASMFLACTLSAGCQLAVTFETIDEGAGGGGTGGATTTATGGGTTTTTTFTDPSTCTSTAECDDSNPCTTDDCPAGKCTHAAANEGVVQTDLDFDLQDCKTPVCHGGVLTDDPAPDQLPAPSPDGCSTSACNGTEPSSTPTNDGDLCGEQPADQCLETRCFGGTCSSQPKADGTVVTLGGTNIPTGSGDCRDLVCQGGALVASQNFLNCYDPGPGNCTVPMCDAQGICHSGARGMQAPVGFPCSGGTCHADGLCY